MRKFPFINKKAVAAFLSFLMPLTGLDLPVVHAAFLASGVPSQPAASEVKIPAPPIPVQIPEALGSIETRSSGYGPLLVHIQTAHGHEEAQRKIQSILHVLKDRYGINTVFVEGSAGHLDPERLAMPEETSGKRGEILDGLVKKGWLKGSELFLLDENGKAEAYGIEDPEAYLKNGQSFQAVLKAKAETGKYLASVDMQIERLKAAYLSPALRDFLKRYEDWDMGLVSLTDWVNTLKDQSVNVLKVDPSDPGAQLDWPMLCRLLTLFKIEKRLDFAAFEKERELFFKSLPGIPGDLLAGLKSALSTESPEGMEAGPLFEALVSRPGFAIAWEQFPQVTLFASRRVLQEELKAGELHDEIQRLSKKILHGLARDEREGKFVEVFEDYFLLSKLFSLEAAPKDYAAILERQAVLTPVQMAGRFADLNAEGRVRDFQFGHSGEINVLFERALDFYQGARERDALMLERIEKRIRETGVSKAAVITGGFHARPFEDALKTKGYAYLRVIPNLSHAAKEDREIYVQSAFDMGLTFTGRATWETPHLTDPAYIPPARAPLPPALLSRLRSELRTDTDQEKAGQRTAPEVAFRFYGGRNGLTWEERGILREWLKATQFFDGDPVLNGRTRSALIAYVNGKIAGVQLYQRFEGENFVQARGLYVAPEYRRSGLKIGMRLRGELLSTLKKFGIKAFETHVDKNVEAQEFHKVWIAQLGDAVDRVFYREDEPELLSSVWVNLSKFQDPGKPRLEDEPPVLIGPDGERLEIPADVPDETSGRSELRSAEPQAEASAKVSFRFYSGLPLDGPERLEVQEAIRKWKYSINYNAWKGTRTNALIAYVDGKPAGLQAYGLWDWLREAETEGLFVAPEYRRSGLKLGTRLRQELMLTLKIWGYETFKTGVARTEDAQAFHENWIREMGDAVVKVERHRREPGRPLKTIVIDLEKVGVPAKQGQETKAAAPTEALASARSELRAADRSGLKTLSELLLLPPGTQWLDHEDQIKSLEGKGLGQTYANGQILFNPVPGFPYRWPVLGSHGKGWQAVVTKTRIKPNYFEFEVELTKEKETPKRAIFQVGSRQHTLAGNQDHSGQTRQVLAMSTSLGLDHIGDMMLKPQGFDWKAHEGEMPDLRGLRLGKVDPRNGLGMTPAKGYTFDWHLLGKTDENWSAEILQVLYEKNFVQISILFTHPEKASFSRNFQIGSRTRKVAGSSGQFKDTEREFLAVSPHLGLDYVAEAMPKPANFDWRTLEKEWPDLRGLFVGTTNESGQVGVVPEAYYHYGWPVLGLAEPGWDVRLGAAVFHEKFMEFEVFLDKGTHPTRRRVFQIGLAPRMLHGTLALKGREKEFHDISVKLGHHILSSLLQVRPGEDFLSRRPEIEGLVGLSLGKLNHAHQLHLHPYEHYGFLWQALHRVHETGEVWSASVISASVQNAGSFQFQVLFTHPDHPAQIRSYQVGPAKMVLQGKMSEAGHRKFIYRITNLNVLSAFTDQPAVQARFSSWYNARTESGEAVDAVPGPEYNAEWDEVVAAFNEIVSQMPENLRPIAQEIGSGSSDEQIMQELNVPVENIRAAREILSQRMALVVFSGGADSTRSELRTDSSESAQQNAPRVDRSELRTSLSDPEDSGAAGSLPELGKFKKYFENKLVQPIELSDQDVSRYFAPSGLEKASAGNVRYYLRLMAPEDQEFLDQWEEQFERDMEWKNQETTAASWKYTFPEFLDLPELSFGLFSVRNGIEKLEGYAGVQVSKTPDDGVRIALEHIEVFYRNIGRNGDLKGVPDVLLDYLFKAAAEPESGINKGFTMRATSLGGFAVAERYQMQPESGILHSLTQTQIQDYVTAAGLQERFNQVTSRAVRGVVENEASELRSLESLIPHYLKTDIEISAEDAERYFGKEAAEKARGEGTRFFIRKLSLYRDVHFLRDWAADYNADTAWKEKWKERLGPHEMVPHFMRFSEPAIGLISLKNSKERLEGFLGLSTWIQDFEEDTLHWTSYLHIDQMETYYRNRGREGDLRGVPDLLLDFLIKVMTDPSSTIRHGVGLTPTTDGGEAIADRYKMSAAEGGRRYLSQEAAVKIADERNLKNRFLPARSELRTQQALGYALEEESLNQDFWKWFNSDVPARKTERELFEKIITGGDDVLRGLLKQYPEKIYVKEVQQAESGWELSALEGRTVYLKLSESFDGIDTLRLKGVRPRVDQEGAWIGYGEQGRGFVPVDVEAAAPGVLRFWKKTEGYKVFGGSSEESSQREKATLQKLQASEVLSSHADKALAVGLYKDAVFSGQKLGFVVIGMRGTDRRIQPLVERDDDSEDEDARKLVFYLSDYETRQMTPLSREGAERFARALGQLMRLYHDAGYYHRFPHFENFGIKPGADWNQLTLQDLVIRDLGTTRERSEIQASDDKGRREMAAMLRWIDLSKSVRYFRRHEDQNNVLELQLEFLKGYAGNEAGAEELFAPLSTFSFAGPLDYYFREQNYAETAERFVDFNLPQYASFKALYEQMLLLEERALQTPQPQTGETEPGVPRSELRFEEALREWNENHYLHQRGKPDSEEGHLGVQFRDVNMETGPGSIYEFDFLKEAAREFLSDRGLAISPEKYSSRKETEMILGELKKSGLIDEDIEKNLLESFAVLEKSAGKYHSDAKLTGLPDRDEFLRAYYHAASETFKSVPVLVEAMARLKQAAAAAPVHDVEDGLELQKETSLHFSLSRGFVREEREQIGLRSGTDALEYFRANPSRAVSVYLRSLEFEVPLSSSIRFALLRFQPELQAWADQERVKETPSAAFQALGRNLLELLSRQQSVTGALWEMYRSGILEAIVPELRNVRDIPSNFNIHAFTVGQHTLYNLKKLDDLRVTEDEQLQKGRAVLEGLSPDQMMQIRLTLLFHDLGKRMSKTPVEPDHAIVSSRDIVPVRLKELGVPADKIENAAWVVRDHMVLNAFARMQDVRFEAKLPVLMKHFALDPGISQERLKLLYLISLTDRDSVNPWAPIMSPDVLDRLNYIYAMLEDYFDTSEPDRSRHIEDIQRQAHAKTHKEWSEYKEQNRGGLRRILSELDPKTIRGYFKNVAVVDEGKFESVRDGLIAKAKGAAADDGAFDYLLERLLAAFSMDQIRDYTEEQAAERLIFLLHLDYQKDTGNPAPVIYFNPQFSRTYERGYEIVVGAAADSEGFFEKATGVLLNHRFDIEEADIRTLTNGEVVDTFQGFFHDDYPDAHAHILMQDQMTRDMRDVFLGTLPSVEALFERGKRPYVSEKIIEAVGTEVQFLEDTEIYGTRASVFNLKTANRLGLLHALSLILNQRGINLVAAPVSTHPAMVNDTFYVNRGGRVLHASEKRDLENYIQSVMSQKSIELSTLRSELRSGDLDKLWPDGLPESDFAWQTLQEWKRDWLSNDLKTQKLRAWNIGDNLSFDFVDENSELVQKGKDRVMLEIRQNSGGQIMAIESAGYPGVPSQEMLRGILSWIKSKGVEWVRMDISFPDFLENLQKDWNQTRNLDPDASEPPVKLSGSGTQMYFNLKNLDLQKRSELRSADEDRAEAILRTLDPQLETLLKARAYSLLDYAAAYLKQLNKAASHELAMTLMKQGNPEFSFVPEPKAAALFAFTQQADANAEAREFLELMGRITARGEIPDAERSGNLNRTLPGQDGQTLPYLDFASGIYAAVFFKNLPKTRKFIFVDNSYFAAAYLEEAAKILKADQVEVRRQDMLAMIGQDEKFGTIRLKNVWAYVPQILDSAPFWDWVKGALQESGQLIVEILPEQANREKFVPIWEKFLAPIMDAWQLDAKTGQAVPQSLWAMGLVSTPDVLTFTKPGARSELRTPEEDRMFQVFGQQEGSRIQYQARWFASVFSKLSEENQKKFLYPNLLLVLLGVKPLYYAVEDGAPNPREMIASINAQEILAGSRLMFYADESHFIALLPAAVKILSNRGWLTQKKVLGTEDNAALDSMDQALRGGDINTLFSKTHELLMKIHSQMASGSPANLEKAHWFYGTLFGYAQEDMESYYRVLQTGTKPLLNDPRYRHGRYAKISLFSDNPAPLWIARADAALDYIFSLLESQPGFETAADLYRQTFSQEVKEEVKRLYAKQEGQDAALLIRPEWPLLNRIFDGKADDVYSADLVTQRGIEALRALNIQPGDTLIDLGAGERGGLGLIAAMLGAKVVAVESRPESVTALRAHAQRLESLIRQAGGSFEIVEGDLADPQTAKTLEGRKFKHLLMTDVVTPSRAMAVGSPKAPPTYEQNKIEKMFKLAAQLKSSEPGRVLFSVPEYVQVSGRMTSNVPFLEPFAMEMVKTSKMGPASASFVSVPYSDGIKRAVLYEFKPMRSELRSFDELFTQALPEALELADDEITAYFGNEALNKAKTSGTRFYLRRLDPEKDLHFISDWKADLNQDTAWQEQWARKGVWADRLPRFSYISPYSVGLVSVTDQKERLEGFVGIQPEYTGFDGPLREWTYGLGISQIENYYRNIGQNGDLRGVSRVLMDFLVKYAATPRFLVRTGLTMTALTPGSESLAEFYGMAADKSLGRVVMTQAQAEAWASEHGLAAVFNPGVEAELHRLQGFSGQDWKSATLVHLEEVIAEARKKGRDDLIQEAEKHRQTMTGNLDRPLVRTDGNDFVGSHSALFDLTDPRRKTIVLEQLSRVYSTIPGALFSEETAARARTLFKTLYASENPQEILDSETFLQQNLYVRRASRSELRFLEGSGSVDSFYGYFDFMKRLNKALHNPGEISSVLLFNVAQFNLKQKSFLFTVQQDIAYEVFSRIHREGAKFPRFRYSVRDIPGGRTLLLTSLPGEEKAPVNLPAASEEDLKEVPPMEEGAWKAAMLKLNSAIRRLENSQERLKTWSETGNSDEELPRAFGESLKEWEALAGEEVYRNAANWEAGRSVFSEVVKRFDSRESSDPETLGWAVRYLLDQLYKAKKHLTGLNRQALFDPEKPVLRVVEVTRHVLGRNLYEGAEVIEFGSAESFYQHLFEVKSSPWRDLSREFDLVVVADHEYFDPLIEDKSLNAEEVVAQLRQNGYQGPVTALFSYPLNANGNAPALGNVKAGLADYHVYPQVFQAHSFWENAAMVRDEMDSLRGLRSRQSLPVILKALKIGKPVDLNQVLKPAFLQKLEETEPSAVNLKALREWTDLSALTTKEFLQGIFPGISGSEKLKVFDLASDGSFLQSLMTADPSLAGVVASAQALDKDHLRVLTPLETGAGYELRTVQQELAPRIVKNHSEELLSQVLFMNAPYLDNQKALETIVDEAVHLADPRGSVVLLRIHEIDWAYREGVIGEFKRWGYSLVKMFPHAPRDYPFTNYIRGNGAADEALYVFARDPESGTAASTARAELRAEESGTKPLFNGLELVFLTALAKLQDEQFPLDARAEETKDGMFIPSDPFMAAEILKEILQGGEHVIDLGSGSGVVLFLAAALGAAKATGYESDPGLFTVSRHLLRTLSEDPRLLLVFNPLKVNIVKRNYMTSDLAGAGNVKDPSKNVYYYFDLSSAAQMFEKEKFLAKLKKLPPGSRLVIHFRQELTDEDLAFLDLEKVIPHGRLSTYVYRVPERGRKTRSELRITENKEGDALTPWENSRVEAFQQRALFARQFGIKPGDRVLSVGTGSEPFYGIALALLGARVDSVSLDPRFQENENMFVSNHRKDFERVSGAYTVHPAQDYLKFPVEESSQKIVMFFNVLDDPNVRNREELIERFLRDVADGGYLVGSVLVPDQYLPVIEKIKGMAGERGFRIESPPLYVPGASWGNQMPFLYRVFKTASARLAPDGTLESSQAQLPSAVRSELRLEAPTPTALSYFREVRAEILPLSYMETRPVPALTSLLGNLLGRTVYAETAGIVPEQIISLLSEGHAVMPLKTSGAYQSWLDEGAASGGKILFDGSWLLNWGRHSPRGLFLLVGALEHVRQSGQEAAAITGDESTLKEIGRILQQKANGFTPEENAKIRDLAENGNLQKLFKPVAPEGVQEYLKAQDYGVAVLHEGNPALELLGANFSLDAGTLAEDDLAAAALLLPALLKAASLIKGIGEPLAQRQVLQARIQEILPGSSLTGNSFKIRMAAFIAEAVLQNRLVETAA